VLAVRTPAGTGDSIIPVTYTDIHFSSGGVFIYRESILVVVIPVFFQSIEKLTMDAGRYC